VACSGHMVVSVWRLVKTFFGVCASLFRPVHGVILSCLAHSPFTPHVLGVELHLFFDSVYYVAEFC